MSASSSSASSDDENYYSAAEFASPEKKSNATAEVVASLQALNEASHEALAYIQNCANVEPTQDDDDDDDERMETNNLWNNTQAIAKQLEDSRNKIDQAWKRAREVHDTIYNNNQTQDSDTNNNNNNNNNDDRDNEAKSYPSIDFSVPVNLDMEAAIHPTKSTNTSTEKHQEPAISDDFRAHYMDMMTETLGDDLEQIHQQGDVDVDILVQCLSSGMQFLTETHDQSFFESLNYDGTKDKAMSNENDALSSSDNSKLSIHQIKQQRLGYLVKWEEWP